MIKHLGLLLSALLIGGSCQAHAERSPWSTEAMVVEPRMMVVADAVEDDLANCEKLSGDAAIAACDRAIASGRFGGRTLANAYIDRCIEWYQKSDYDRAVADCNAAIGVDPTTVLAHVHKARALLGRKDANGALAAANEAVRLLPESATPYAVRGDVFRALGNRDAAKADYTKAVNINDSSFARKIAEAGLAALAAEAQAADPNTDVKNCSSLSGDPAISACDRAIGSGKLAGKALAQAYLNRCWQWYFTGQNDIRTPAAEWLSKGHYERAVADCSASIRIDPTNGQAYVYRVRALLAKKDLAAAIAAADEIVRMAPEYSFAIAVRGQVLLALQRYGDANTDFSKVLALGATGTPLTIAQAGKKELDEWNKNADDSRGACQKSSGDAAIAACSRAIATGKFTGPDLAGIYGDRCYEYFGISDFNRSLEDCNAAIKLDPKRGFFHFYRARTLLALRNVDAAIAAANDGLKLLPESPFGYAVRGDIRRQLGLSADARSDYAQALILQATGLSLQMAQAGLAALPVMAPSSDPDGDASKCRELSGEPAIAACSRAIGSGKLTGLKLAVTYVNRCFERLRITDYEEAAADCDHATRVDPTVVLAYIHKADALLGKSDASGALAAADQAIRLSAEDARAYAVRGEAHRLLRHSGEAKADFTTAISLGAPNSAARRLAQGGLMALASKINVTYDVPKDPRYKPFYVRLRQQRVLERLQQFLSPLRLPRELDVKVAQCDAAAAPYRQGGAVVICYELIDRIARIVNEHAERGSLQASHSIVGAFIQATLHDVAHALFDILDVPVWGRREDAADQLAAFIMSQFGEYAGRIAMVGSANVFWWSNRTWTGNDFAMTQSPEAQRYYNYLCIAYGGYPITFADMKKEMPEHRARQCWSEYGKVRHAFDLRIMPFVDPDLAVRVKSTDWIWPEDEK